MAIGDVVVQFGGDNAVIDFQPAAGVEVVITCWASNNGDILFNNDTNVSQVLVTANVVENPAAGKVFVNNTVFARIAAQGAGNFSAFSGITVNT